VIHHTPDEPKATYPASAPIRGTLGNRPLVVETYSRANQAGKRYYWRTRHTSNGEIMANHRGYVLEKDRDHAVDVLWPDLSVDPLG
jgi:uncharacterized protein YegP (UPF0339 family)